MSRVVELTSSLAGIEDVEIYTTASAMQNYVGADGEYSEFKGLKKAIKKSSDERQKRKMIKTQSKAKARTAKADAKKGEAKAKQLAAKASEAGVQGDIALASALKSSEPSGATKGGMPKWGWVAIGVGVLAVVGGGAYFMLKKK